MAKCQIIGCNKDAAHRVITELVWLLCDHHKDEAVTIATGANYPVHVFPI